MINVNPQGDIWLCKTGLKNDYKNTLTFASSQAQYTFFASKVQQTLNEYTYIKHDSSIKVGLPIDKIVNCDYLFYGNGGFESDANVVPYYYCFITNMEYVNENTTLITFETDVFQTWYWRIVYNKCFVEREHTNNDTIGHHTVPEGLETGDYIVDDKFYYTGLDDLMYMIQATESSTGGTNVKATNFGGVFMQGYAYACENISQFTQIITAYDNASKHDAVYNCYMIPSNFVATTPGQLQFDGQVAPVEDVIQISKPSTIDGYSPRNNKLFTYPYRYLLTSNNNGSSNVYYYERWDAVTCNFMVKGVPVVGGSIKLVPTIYDGQLSPDEDQGLMAGKFPTLNWATDPYTNWLTQNSVNIGVGVATAGLNVVGGIASATLGGPARCSFRWLNDYKWIKQYNKYIRTSIST